MIEANGEHSALAAHAVRRALELGLRVGVAESLTGGAVCVALVEMPGASQVVRGAVVAYDIALKESLLGVSAALLDGPGPVSAEVAQAMASGVCEATGADIGLATTGAAGPEPHGGKPPGTAFVAVCRGKEVLAVKELHLEGDRDAVTHGVVGEALKVLSDTLDSLQEKGLHAGEQA